MISLLNLGEVTAASYQLSIIHEIIILNINPGGYL
jgi:hypothetical protein